MKYLLQPTDNDVLHYAKGSESKSHKYISRVLNKGKWAYIYAKNRLRGNQVTNKNVKPIGEFKSDPFGDKLQYSPTIKTETIDDRSSDKQGHRSRSSKVLTEPMDTRSYLAGTETWKNIAKKYGITDPGSDGTFDTKLNAHQKIGKEVVTNQTGLVSQYTPSYNRNSGSTYSPTIKTLKYEDGKYRPTEPLDWRKRASVKTNKKHAIYSTTGGFPTLFYLTKQKKK